MSDTTAASLPGDLAAAFALLRAYDQAGHQLAGAAIAHLLVDPDADEPTLREQFHRLTVEADSLAEGLAQVSHAWQDSAEVVADRAELERLRVPRAILTRLPTPDGEPADEQALPFDLRDLRGLVRRSRRVRRRLRRLAAGLLAAVPVGAFLVLLDRAGWR